MNLNGFTGKVINEIIVKDLDLLEKTPVHEVVDIGDSDEEGEVNIHQFILKIERSHPVFSDHSSAMRIGNLTLKY